MTKGREDAETAANNDGTIAQRAGVAVPGQIR